MMEKKLFDLPIRPKLRLSEVERLIKIHRIIIPPLSRATLVNMCEDGTFETAGNGPTAIGWLIYEESFKEWVLSLDSRGKEVSTDKEGSRFTDSQILDAIPDDNAA